MTTPEAVPRPAPAFRLGVIGNRDLQDANRSVLCATVTRFLRQLRAAIDRSLSDSRAVRRPGPYAEESPTLFLIDSLAEGADQLVAEVAIDSDFGFHVRCPIPFEASEYKARFTYDREESITRFDRITQDPANDPIVVELACWSGQGGRADAYAAAADILLDNSDLLLAIYDPSLPGSEGGTAETVKKALATGLRVVGVDIHDPERLALIPDRGGAGGATDLTSESLYELVSSVFLPPGTQGGVANARVGGSQVDGLYRYLREPLITGNAFKRSVALMMSRIYGAFWSAIPWVGSIGAALRARAHDSEPDIDALVDREDPEHARIIDEVQRGYLARMAPVDSLARFYMSLYRGSFVMNFLLGAFAVLFGLLSYFNPANQLVWVWAEVAVLAVILVNFVASRLWNWHGRALDYRFIAEYLRQMTMLAPLGRSAPLIRPAPQYHGHDPTESWMSWYVRAIDRAQGLVNFRAPDAPAMLRMDDAFLHTMRSRLAREWLFTQLRYYQDIERRFEGAIAVFRALMALLFVITAAGVGAHLMHLSIALDPSSWREDAVLTIIVAGMPAFLGALHGIAVQGEIEVTAERASNMSAHIARTIADMAPSGDSVRGCALRVPDLAADAARMMLSEVLDWRIIHSNHEVELT